MASILKKKKSLDLPKGILKGFDEMNIKKDIHDDI